MDVEIQARYAGRAIDPAASARALSVDPNDILLTVLAIGPAGRPVGHAALRLLGTEWEVKRVVVLAEARGRGLASQLMAYLEEFAAARGVHRLILQTGDRQPEAVALYRGLGYRPIAIYQPYTDAIPFSLCFEKVLSTFPATDRLAAQAIFETVSPAAVTDAGLRDQLIDVWVAATNAGGAVGFVAPAPRPEIAATLDAALARVVSGLDSLGVLRADGSAVGMGLLVSKGTALTAHWRTVLRVMVHPDHQGSGADRVLMNGLHRQAVDLGLEHLVLTIRDGLQLERFYEQFGYRVIGRHPGAIRVAPGDDRDEIMLIARL